VVLSDGADLLLAPRLWLSWAVVPADPDEALARYQPALDAGERARCDQLRAEHVAPYVFAHGLLRESLARLTGQAPATFRFERDDFGKPRLASPAPPALAFNLTHTDGLVAVVVGDGGCTEVGVDAERIRPLPRLAALAQRFFAASEAHDLECAPPDARARRFFAYWTLKEAWAKARGFGLAAPLDRVQLALPEDPGSTPALTFAPGLPDQPDRWQLFLFHPTPAHVLAVAAANPTAT
jgi:4'-phosphopantetheinyl transferase